MKRILILTMLLGTFIYAHGGRTNAQGCHNQRGGTYHCHGKKVTKHIQKQYIASASGSYDCSHKYCKYMSSCEEAYYKYKQCGHMRLDGDRDGVPCENICGRR